MTTTPSGIPVTLNYTAPLSSNFNDTANISSGSVPVVPNVVLKAILTPVDTIHAGANTGVIAVATFTDPAGPGPLSAYTATITWGDGHVTSGSITLASGVFTVKGSDTYSAVGKYSPVVKVSHLTSTPQSVTDSNRINVTPLTAHLVVANAATITGLEGRTVSGSVGTFTAVTASNPASDFSAVINWGDGTATTAGTIVSLGSGKFKIVGTHVYHEESAAAGYAVTVTLKDVFGDSVTLHSTAKIADAPLENPTGSAASTVASGTAFTNKVLGNFRDDDATDIFPGDYVGVINWGDGTTSSATFVHTARQPTSAAIGTLKVRTNTRRRRRLT